MDKKEVIEIINNLTSKRNDLVQKYEQDCIKSEQIGSSTPEFPVAADQLQYDILTIMTKEFDNLDFDFIFENIANFGWHPNLVYSGNGSYQISGESYISIDYNGCETVDFPITISTDNDCWFKTSREALRHFLNMQ
jgi:hypothetical protein